jgi:hypothetical protein
MVIDRTTAGTLTEIEVRSAAWLREDNPFKPDARRALGEVLDFRLSMAFR